MIVSHETLEKLPPYVRPNNGCALVLVGYRIHNEYGLNYSVEYRRVAGQWEYDKFRIEEDGRVIGEWPVGFADHLNGQELIPTTREFWLKDNEGYVSAKARAFNDPIPKIEVYDCCQDEDKNGWSHFCRTCGNPIVF